MDRVGGFAAMSLVLVLIPGPSVLFVLGRALAHGRRTALGSVVGNAIGAYALIALVSLGLGEVVSRSVALFVALKLAGAAYLVFLGVKAFRHRGALSAALHDESGSAVPPRRGDLRTLWEGFVVGVTNPKTMVFFAAVLPQFVNRDAGRVHEQMLLLGLVFTAIALLCDSVWALTASAARSWFASSPRRMAAVGGTGGLAMIGLGVTVAATGRADS
ncbi:LysE family translocator [Actinacidiphila bryophytorum]|uniref:Threonine/homoserine/homoserine lactone efflux protein n=2 Tax=Actinacidiphila bryophytorum TaxID=1436133 RepID=A0A9W4H661_9ACTN|nr:LysE family translocator [Actinacidiphila bryophytorum]MBM9438607.1 LysE family translocator [Actinacidiphila bryophytorum]CAG7653728.1 Threonine/homoserine/homoserine lactone efflux protein [Actinacidiphila bryophytorum]